jgi:peptidoglycan hydrolase CwlO-like protein
MKNIIILIIACLALSSCSNMESDADKVCDLTTEMIEMMPPMVKLSMKAGFGDEDSKKELDELQASLEKMSKELESIKGKYDEEEFKAYFSENCAGAKELLEMGKAFDSIGK